jgi:two-component system, sensor histidine kinase
MAKLPFGHRPRRLDVAVIGLAFMDDPDRVQERRRVLVVDDNRDAAESLATLVDMWGHEAIIVHDGPAALAAALEHRPDFILLDIGLPDMDGYEVARRLKAEERTSAAVLVAMTGYGRAEDMERSRAAGFDHHLVKPVDPDVVRRILARRDPA